MFAASPCSIVGLMKMPERDRAPGVIVMKARLSLWSCKSGATTIEYAMVAALISVAAFVVLGTIGSSVSGFFQSVASKL